MSLDKPGRGHTIGLPATSLLQTYHSKSMDSSLIWSKTDLMWGALILLYYIVNNYTMTYTQAQISNLNSGHQRLLTDVQNFKVG